MKVCASCQEELPYDMFHKRGSGYQSLCKPCRKSYDAEFWKRKREEYLPKKYERKKKVVKEFIEYKRSLSCCVCDESAIECLDFHHIDPSNKIKTVSNLSRQSSTLSRIMKEVEKCIVLCANCHRKYHAGNLTLPEQCDIVVT